MDIFAVIQYFAQFFGCSHFSTSFSRYEKAKRIERKFKTENPNQGGDWRVA